MKKMFKHVIVTLICVTIISIVGYYLYTLISVQNNRIDSVVKYLERKERSRYNRPSKENEIIDVINTTKRSSHHNSSLPNEQQKSSCDNKETCHFERYPINHDDTIFSDRRHSSSGSSLDDNEENLSADEEEIVNNKRIKSY